MNPFTGARKAKPTKRHRPAIWENMLGAVYACNDKGEVRYFDYRWDEARAFAGADREDADLRVARCSRFYFPDGPRAGKMVLWIKN